MRIAVWYNMPSGGAKRALHDHARGLAGRGHDLEFFTPEGPGLSYLPVGVYGKEHVFPAVDAEAGVRLWASVRRDPATRRKRLRAVDGHCRLAAAAINSGRFDVLYANTCWITASPPVGRYTTTPSVLYLQEPKRGLFEADEGPPFASMGPPGRSRFAPWYVRQSARNRIDTEISRRQVRDEWLSAKAFGRILVNSYFSRESVLRAYGWDAAVCYLGVDKAAFAPSGHEVRDYLVGVGSVAPAKNIAFVIRAVGHLPPPRPRLVWVANSVIPSHLEELSALARGLGVELDVKRLVSQDELTVILAGARCMAYAPRLEPFGYAPLEANACGTPVVAVAEGGVRETVRDGVNGLLVEPTPKAMAAGVARLLADSELARRLGAGGRRLVETEWTLDAATDRLERHLTEVAGGARP